MRLPWRTTALVVLVSGTTSVLVLLGSVTYGDVVHYHNWVEPAAVASAQVGQYYVVDDDGRVHEPLCLLRAEDVDPPPAPRTLPGWTYVNQLGQLTPAIIRLVGTILPISQPVSAAPDPTTPSHELTLTPLERTGATASALARLTRRVQSEEALAELEKQGDARAAADASRLRECGSQIVASLDDGLTVCQVDEVVRNGSRDLIAIGFMSRCLVRETDDEPRFLPDIRQGSLLSEIKHALDLIQVEPVRRPQGV